jgi:hypothetical protein
MKVLMLFFGVIKTYKKFILPDYCSAAAGAEYDQSRDNPKHN